MMRQRWVLVLAMALVALACLFPLTGCNNGDNNNAVFLAASLGSEQEVPETTSPASGTASVTVNAERNTISVTLETTDLNPGTVQAVHFHYGLPGETGPVILNIFTTADGAFTNDFFTQVTSADFVPQPSVGIVTFGDAVNAVLDGKTYINIHTTAFPDGAIRGQVGPVQLLADLSGAEVVTPVNTLAAGNAEVNINREQDTVTVVLETQGLLNVTGGSINFGRFGTNGPTLVNLFPQGTTGFTGNRTFTITSANFTPQPGFGISTFSDFINQLIAGNTYIILTTQNFPNGEIRGQIEPPIL